MNLFLLATLWLAGVGAALAQPSGLNAYHIAMACLDLQASKLDDGKSDPRKIGSTVSSRCREEQRQYLSVQKGRPVADPEISQMLDEPAFKEWWISRSTTSVMELRAKRRAL